MSVPHRARGVKVLKAVSSQLRLQILNLLFDKGALSYTELITQLKMNPSRDAGRFAYHLKFLLKADLVEADAETKKYYLTDLGKMVIDVADRVEKKAVKPRGMLVRTSHFTFEEFDVNKIANSLIREAKMPADLAQKIGKEAEKLLTKSKIKFLTSALIRETVNSLLIEKGLEEYRHKLTRLGLPVHEVTALIEAKDHSENSDDMLNTAGKTVFREYTLLNVFPRDIADAHLSGAIHINELSTWILKPNEIMHDLRFFLQSGLKSCDISSMQLAEKPPETFESALAATCNMLLLAKTELSETQVIDYFNVFLAPYARNMGAERIRESLRLFILNVNQHVDTCIGLELLVPDFIAKKSAIGPEGKLTSTYGDFAEESRLIALLLLEIYTDESQVKPIFNPKLIVKIPNETLMDEHAKALLVKSHALAIEKGNIYFANAMQREEKKYVFSASGTKLGADLSADWETDTLRTGNIGHVTINLPRIVRETENDKNRFFDILNERCELAARALGIKHRALKQYGKIALPFIMQGSNGDTYFRLDNCVGIISLAGFKEATETFTGKPSTDPINIKFSEEISENAFAYVHKLGRKHGKRLFPGVFQSPDASGRLAKLDIEKYGVAKVKFSGSREEPYYSTTRRLTLQTASTPHIPSEEIAREKSLKNLSMGGNLTIIDADGSENKPEELMNLTAMLMEKHRIEFLTYNRKVTHCTNCRKSWYGDLHKCPQCGSIGTLALFDRFRAT